MTILDRYVLKEYVRNFSLILCALMTVYIIVDFFERVRMFLSNNATIGHILSYLLYNIPMILVLMLPITVLLASLVTFTILTRNNEVTAMKANGLSLYRVSASLIAAAIVASLAIFLLNEFVTPRTNRKVKHIRYIEVQKRESMGTFKKNEIWYRGQNGIYNFGIFDPLTGTIQGIKINYLDDHMKLVKRIDARRAAWEKDRWVFYDILVTTFDEKRRPLLQKLASAIVDIPESPEDLSVVQKGADEMGYFELLRYIAKIRSEGFDASRYLPDLYGKISFPFVTIILTMLGIAFSVRSERSGGIFRSLGIGIVIGLSYWIIFGFSLSLGRSGSIPPAVAAWAANSLFGAAALALFCRVKT
ncbi:MAG: LPS export ABC transporter permease LptG [Deltaproteobacteria bacterium]|nr:LPS export ABC transporter permease LptG [Deltaproteobacteria bacterium]